MNAVKNLGKHLKTLLKGGVLAGLLCLPVNASAHEVVGEVTPLMIHMKRALLLIDNGKDKEAVHEIRMVYEDFSHEMGMGTVMRGSGLKTAAAQIDQRFRTRLAPSLEAALRKEDISNLQKTIQQTAFLLMLEKFHALQPTLGRPSSNLEKQKTIFWLGRNYFSYLLEPTLALKDPVEEKRLDRLLDKMLYRLEDNLPQEFEALRQELERSVAAAFNLDLPSLTRSGAERE